MGNELQLVERVNDWVCSIIAVSLSVAYVDGYLLSIIEGCSFVRWPMVFT